MAKKQQQDAARTSDTQVASAIVSEISAVHFRGLRITTADGQPATLAVVDMQGRIIESGPTVVRAAWDVAIKAYRNFLSDKGILRVKTVSPDEHSN